MSATLFCDGATRRRPNYTVYRNHAMPDSFFQSDKKRKRSKPGRSGPSTRAKPVKRQERDENLSSDAEGEGQHVDLDDMDYRAGRGGEDQLSDEELIDENETAAEKRVRMAKGYLAKVRKEIEEGASAVHSLAIVRG